MVSADISAVKVAKDGSRRGDCQPLDSRAAAYALSWANAYLAPRVTIEAPGKIELEQRHLHGAG